MTEGRKNGQLESSGGEGGRESKKIPGRDTGDFLLTVLLPDMLTP